MPTTIEEIKAKEAAVKAQLADPAIEVIKAGGAFFTAQLGLHEALVGPDGRIWVNRHGDDLVCVFSPNWFVRPLDRSNDI